MIFVDKMHYSEMDFQLRFRELSEMDGTRNPEGRLFTVCLKHPFDIVSMVLYLRERDGSVLLLHADTPFETARHNALKSGSHFLLYGNWNSITVINEEHYHDDPSLLQYSSGTTGNPKLVSRSWKEIGTEIENYNLQLNAADDENPIILVPVSHSFGLIAGVLTAINRGSSPYIIGDKNPKFALHMIQNIPKTLVYGVPYLFHLLNSLGKGVLNYHKLVSSGAPLSEMLFHQLGNCADELWHQYGSSETGCISIGSNPSSPFDVGKSLRHIKLSFQRIPSSDPNESEWNEIIVSTACKTVATQDIGCQTESGSLCVLGRNDDLINVSGLKVIPAEVENVIGRMPGILEVVVYKTKHKIWGEAVKAMVIAAQEVKAEEIKAWCLQYMPSYKVPGIIQFVKEIPKMPSGKLSRKLLQELECAI